MVGKTHAPTAAQKRHMDKVVKLGCLCCRQLGIQSQAELHHVVEGFRRLGHDSVLPLCPAHHRYPTGGLGPSIASGSKPFAARWGSQRELLAEVNRLLDTLAN